MEKFINLLDRFLLQLEMIARFDNRDIENDRYYLALCTIITGLEWGDKTPDTMTLAQVTFCVQKLQKSYFGK